MITEAEKSHSILSASWRTRKVHGIIESESKGLRTREADHVFPSLKHINPRDGKPKNQEIQ